MDIPLPFSKLSFGLIGHEDSPGTAPKEKVYVVLVANGSFNPPTYMHLRMFELARDALNAEGYCVIGGYMSPVNDAYKKRARQSTFQRSLTVLSRVQSILFESGQVPRESLKVMLVCGSDLLHSFSIPGAWIPDQVRTICRDYGVVCIRREGQDVEKIISDDEILNEFRDNIKVVDELIPNQISSTRVRDCISRGLSIKYLTADEVIDYIREQHLYLNSDDK
ncbi:nicotinamide/nicotinic acid mononucleotide adenylyltransferase [Quercus suber]|uniref:Nicotinamide/nicotinic acid mononucleotide adenylyltransferase n=1 Tax=Quercus suber TaxID=58331 RepID=A0AAW0KRS0_QUESU